MTKHTAPFFFLTLLAGCGPVYDTVYHYTPPSSSGGQHCIDNCEDYQRDCEQFENDRAADCDERQREQTDRCNDRIVEEKHRAPKWTECGKTESCTADTKKCEERYRGCYQACGGRVTSTQECVAFCDSEKRK